jgi:hypothetical protein
MKKLNTCIIFFIILIICYLFLFSKLFPFSPVAIGFLTHEMPNTVIYTEKGSSFRNYKEIDDLTKNVEQFHQLKFLKKPKIYIFSNKSSYLNRTLTKARFYAYPNNVLVVSPWAIQEAQEGKISLEIYVGHELSHIILFQHMGFISAYKYPKWFMEGIAMYSVNQMGTSWYPSKDDTYKTIKNGVFFPPDFYKTRKENHIKLGTKNQIAFMYSEFACIVDYLIEVYGKDKFLIYMKTLLHGKNYKNVFKDIYKINFDKFILDFKKHIVNSRLA